jgi:hypothetical protein
MKLALKLKGSALRLASGTAKSTAYSKKRPLAVEHRMHATGSLAAIRRSGMLSGGGRSQYNPGRHRSAQGTIPTFL